MKKLILSAAIVLSSLSAFAQVTTDSKTEVATTEPKEVVATKAVATQEEYTAIVATEVPAPVHAALEVAHPGAVVTDAYVNEAKEYKLEVTVEDEKATLYADAEGNWMKK